MSIEVNGANAVIGELERLMMAIKNPKRALTRIGLKVHGRARLNAPIGPTQGDLDALKKTKRKRKRKASAVSRPKPGSLQNSISMQVGPADVTVRVASNTPAGKYAWMIHNEKGSRWSRRGPGTVKKGAQADDKFIERAVESVVKDGTVEQILRDEIATQASIEPR